MMRMLNVYIANTQKKKKKVVEIVLQVFEEYGWDTKYPAPVVEGPQFDDVIHLPVNIDNDAPKKIIESALKKEGIDSKVI